MIGRSISQAATLAATGLFMAFSVHAGTPGWYFGVEGGASFLDESENAAESDATLTSGGVGGGGGLLEIPGVLILFPTPGGGGGATINEGEQVDFGTDYDTGWLGGVTVGRLFENGFRTELELRHQENDIETIGRGGMTSDTDGEVNATTLLANAFYDFNSTGSFHPYLGVGAGAARVELKDLPFPDNADNRLNGDDTVFAYQGAAGIAYDITDRLTADLGYRYFDTDDSNFRDSSQAVDFEYTQQVAMLSLRYVFNPVGRADSDGDGVPDYKDKCPNTPQGMQVDADGCAIDDDGDGVPNDQDECPNTPEGVQVGPDGCPLDSDGDGVADYKDDCPNTPPGTQVNDKGCPLVVDSDGDGVPDDQDECPGTPAGVAVLANGCAVGQAAILQGVNFEFDKAVLTASAEKILDRVAQTLKDSPGFVVELAGHTDALGSDSYNQDLSERRAQSVKRYLVQQGVSADRLEANGYGENEPIATNDTEEGRASNRRVELRVLDEQ